MNNPQGLVGALDKLGMPLFGMQTPNGYSWVSEPWVSTGALVTRMNFALVLAGDRVAGTRTDWTKLLASVPTPRSCVGEMGEDAGSGNGREGAQARVAAAGSAGE